MSTYGDLLDNDVSQENVEKCGYTRRLQPWKPFPVMPVFSKQLKGFQRKNTQKVYALMMLKGT
jgi:hypothetical protein